jgi:hypothetical protein
LLGEEPKRSPGALEAAPKREKMNWNRREYTRFSHRNPDGGFIMEEQTVTVGTVE